MIRPSTLWTHIQTLLSGGVGDSGYVVVNVPPAALDVTDLQQQSSFDLYPNPVRHTLTIETANQIQKSCIYNLSGQKVKELNLNEPQIDVRDLQKGLYLLHLQFDGRVETVRFVKE